MVVCGDGCTGAGKLRVSGPPPSQPYLPLAMKWDSNLSVVDSRQHFFDTSKCLSLLLDLSTSLVATKKRLLTLHGFPTWSHQSLPTYNTSDNRRIYLRGTLPREWGGLICSNTSLGLGKCARSTLFWTVYLHSNLITINETLVAERIYLISTNITDSA